MEIQWAQNPLRTVVVLDDADRWVLREAMQEDRDPDVDDVWMNDLHADLEAALLGVHVGDCTCVPCSCLKCHAEAYLRIDTMPGLNKYMAHQVAAAFGEDDRTIDQAIEKLANYNPIPASPMWDGKHDIWIAHLPRWREEARLAHAWLVKYRDTAHRARTTKEQP